MKAIAVTADTSIVFPVHTYPELRDVKSMTNHAAEFSIISRSLQPGRPSRRALQQSRPDSTAEIGLAVTWLHVLVICTHCVSMKEVHTFRDSSTFERAFQRHLQMTMEMGFTVEMGIPWKWDKNYINGGNLNGNGKQPTRKWEWPIFPCELVPIPGHLQHHRR